MTLLPKTSLRRITGLALALCLTTFARGQVDVVTQEIDGTTYYIHQVEAGHTLYAISKLYKVELEGIIRQNPEVKSGLKIGQTLRIAVPPGTSLDRWENPIDIRDGLLIHKVKRGETLYAISRTYKVDINAILELNASANDGLSKGQELRIPFNDVEEIGLDIAAVVTPVLNRPAEPDSLYLHRVLPKETLYGIAREYQVDIADIERLNPSLQEVGLQAGQMLRLPLPDPIPSDRMGDEVEMEVGRTDSLVVPRDTSQAVLPLIGNPFPEVYRMGLLLPFHVEGIDTTLLNRKQRKLQTISLNLYRGFQMGLDSLKDWGLDVEVVVRDVYGESSVQQALSDDALRHAGVVIGPLQRSALMAVADALGSQGVHLVCPVPQSNKILLAHPNLSKTVPSSLSQMERLGQYIAGQHQGDNVVLLNSKDTRDVRNVLYFKNSFELTLADSANDALLQLEPAGHSAGKVADLMKPGVRNIIVAPTVDQPVILDLMTKLGMLDDEIYDITVFGLEDWLGFDFIDSDYKERFKLTVPVAQFVDYERTEVQAFIASFRERYNSEPDAFAFSGFDLALYYGRGLMQYGLHFAQHLPEFEHDGLLTTGFDYVKTGVETGFENTHSFLVRQENYRLTLVQPRREALKP